MKKLLLSLGTLAAVVAPVASVVACGSSTKKTTATDTKASVLAELKKVAGYDAMNVADKKAFDEKTKKESLADLQADLEKAKKDLAGEGKVAVVKTNGAVIGQAISIPVTNTELTFEQVDKIHSAIEKRMQDRLTQSTVDKNGYPIMPVLDGPQHNVVDQKAKLSDDQIDGLISKIKAIGGTFATGKEDALRTALKEETLESLADFKTKEFVTLPTSITDEATATSALFDSKRNEFITQINALSIDATVKTNVIAKIKAATDEDEVQAILASEPVVMQAIQAKEAAAFLADSLVNDEARVHVTITKGEIKGAVDADIALAIKALLSSTVTTAKINKITVIATDSLGTQIIKSGDVKHLASKPLSYDNTLVNNAIVIIGNEIAKATPDVVDTTSATDFENAINAELKKITVASATKVETANAILKAVGNATKFVDDKNYQPVFGQKTSFVGSIKDEITKLLKPLSDLFGGVSAELNRVIGLIA